MTASSHRKAGEPGLSSFFNSPLYSGLWRSRLAANCILDLRQRPDRPEQVAQVAFYFITSADIVACKSVNQPVGLLLRSSRSIWPLLQHLHRCFSVGTYQDRPLLKDACQNLNTRWNRLVSGRWLQADCPGFA